ncbi:MAG: tetratricopeptide repeat protein, partial [Planctomycetaceae bacterium]|nr:tetratricopeptide repeat protein [Planctomycetaceae bacterium]
MALVFAVCGLLFRDPMGLQHHVRADEQELQEEEARRIQIADRFLNVLEKNPRYGTALDRVYGHHVEFGSLDEFIQTLQDRAQDDDSGTQWMLLGMFESQRGNDAAAVDALLKADALRRDDALAGYYLGQAQLRIGQNDEAIASFERAIERKPARADLLEIFQTLGRVHQRAQRTDEALAVWQRLESLFPDDPRVLEQIAVTLAEEGQAAEALPKYQKLAELVRDDYRRVVYLVSAAELTIKTGKREEGIGSLEEVLAGLNPDSWLHRDVRRRIEDVFLRSGDQDSLVNYYRNWLEEHPEDVEGMSRLAKFLASSARVPEPTKWMEKALQLAPSRADLRKAFIDQLVDDQRYAEAVRQYEQLVAATPGNTDFLRDWGKLVLRNKDVPEADRKKEAVRIWNQIPATRPDDALTVSQVADLFRQNKMNGEAEKLYRRSVELAPGDPQYREYLGEFLHIQKRPDEALTVWAGIAEGDRRTAVNITRLAEVYNSFGFPEKAIVEVADAVKLDPKDFALQIRSADYHAKAGKYDEAMLYVDAANALAETDEERDAVIQQRIDVLQVSQKLDDAADELLASLKSNTDAATADWYLAARYLEAARRWPEAAEAIDNAIRLEPKSVPAMTVAARIAETSGDYGRAAEMNRTLADIDRRSRGDHLMNVSRLEAQMGRADEALEAARELIVSAPGNTDNYEFFAQTCFRLGRNDEGLDALRKAVRINPNEPHLIMALASALAEQIRTDEAIEVYWRAFEKSDEIEDRIGLTMKLAALYQQTNQFDKLIERFERDRREDDKRREMTLCLAQAWHTAGDITAARQELESLLSEDTRDTNLLNQLAKLCQDGADIDAAIGYQRQLVAIAPGHETEFPLAGMLMANGEMDEAREIFVKLTQREEDPVRQIKAIDSLITQGNYESAIGVIEPLLAQNREDWELLYREGVAWASLEKKEEAVNRFERILALTLPYDSPGRSAEARLKQAQAKAKSDNLRGITTAVPQKQSPLAMRTMSAQVSMACGLTSDDRYYGSNQTQPVWTPEAYGVARMAAFGWLLRYEGDAKTASVAGDPPDSSNQADEPLENTVHAKADAENAIRDAIYDSLYVAQLKNDFQRTFQIARRLANEGGKEERQFFLTSLNLRNTDFNQTGRSSSNQANIAKTPLGEEDLQLVRDCYEQLNDDSKQLDLSAMYGGNVAFGSNGQVYVLVGNSYQALPGVFRGEGGFLSTLVEELRLAGETEEAQKLLDDHLAKASSANELVAAMGLIMKEERHDELPDYLQRWHEAALKQIAEAPVVAARRGSSRSGRSADQSASVLPTAMNTMMQWMGNLGAEEENARVLSILDACLDVAEAEAVHRRKVLAADTRQRQPVTGSSSFGSISVYYGKEQIRANISFPPSCTWVDHSSCPLLYQAFEVLKRNDVPSDLVERMRERYEQRGAADSDGSNNKDPDLQICRQMYLASSLWWIDEQDSAVELMTEAVSLAGDDLSMQFHLANMHESRQEFDEALTLIDRIRPRDQKVLQQRELSAMQLAERLGDIDRARSAAERLFGLRLDSQTQLSLVDRMKRLGMSEMADAILARAERTATNQTSSLASLMMLYQGQGKTDQANQLAHMLLRKTTSPMTILSRSGRNPSRYRTRDSSLRTRAIKVLNRTGGLKLLIEQLEAQLERSPGSVMPLQQLIEFYGVTGQSDEATKKLQEGLEAYPKSPALRLQMAQTLEQSGKASEACDQYMELLKIQPNWLMDDFYQIERVFRQAKRGVDLANTLSQIDLRQVSQPYNVFNAASNLMREDSGIEVAMALMERAFETFPTYRRYALQNISNNSVWKSDRFYQFAKRAVLPTVQDIRSNPWYGLDNIYSYSGNGEVNAHFHRMLQGIKSTDKISDLEASVRTLLEQQPGWHGGEAMLAITELNSDRKEDALKRLQKLAGDEEITRSMPRDSCWIIGQELNRFEETRDLATRLFEQGVSASSNNSSNQIRYSPVAQLINSYVRDGRKADARELLHKQLSSASFDGYSGDYQDYQRFENSMWAAEKFLTIQSPVDAIRLYRQMLDTPDRLAAADRYRGGNNHFENAAKKGLSDALASVSGENADELMSQLLAVPETVKPGQSAVDLMISVPDAAGIAKETIRSSYVNLLVTLSKEAEVSKSIAERLAAMQQQHPTDLSITIAATAWKQRIGRPDAAEAVNQLAVL